MITDRRHAGPARRRAVKDVSETDMLAFDGAEALARPASGKPVAVPAMESVRAVVGGQVLVFHLNMAQDPIQSHSRAGKFDQRAELDRVRKNMKTVSQIIDISANIGNRALCRAALGRTARVVVEPNPQAIAPPTANVPGDRLEDVIDLSVRGARFQTWMKDTVYEVVFQVKPHAANNNVLIRPQPGETA